MEQLPYTLVDCSRPLVKNALDDILRSLIQAILASGQLLLAKMQ